MIWNYFGCDCYGGLLTLGWIDDEPLIPSREGRRCVCTRGKLSSGFKMLNTGNRNTQYKTKILSL